MNQFLFAFRNFVYYYRVNLIVFVLIIKYFPNFGRENFNLFKMKTKKKTGRRLKRDWRRKIDVTDVDNYLNEKRLEERIGYINIII